MTETLTAPETPTEAVAASTTAVIEEPKPPTLAETEKAYRESFDKSRGRDMAKLYPETVKEPPPAEAKPAEAKTEEKKPDAPAVAEPLTRADRNLGKVRARLATERAERIAERTQFEDRIRALEAKVTAPAAPAKAVEAATEPSRDDFTSDADYFAALRKYDKDLMAAETKRISDERAQGDAQRQWDLKVEDFNARLAVSKAKHIDWDDVVSKTKVTFNPILQGALMASDTDLLYHFATNPKDARRLNDMEEGAVVASTNADDVTAVLKYLSSHPDEIDKLNGLTPVKATRYIGEIEHKIKAELKAVPPVKVEEAKPTDDKRTSLGAPAATPAAQAVVSGADATRETVPLRAKPEPPPRMAGGAPSTADWREPQEMSFADRERLYKEDPRNRRR